MTTSDCSFVLSVERGKLEAQAVLLVESLRRFGGVYANCPVYAISPRRALQMSRACQNVLKSLGVYVIIEELLSTNEKYGSIARLVTCAWAEKYLTSEIIVSLDDDLFFAREPDFALTKTDLFARPVDVKGMCTTGPNDYCDPYWRNIAQVCGVDYEQIPWIETTVDRVHVKASYNGGMIAVRRQLGLFQKAEHIHQILKSKDLSPRTASDIEVFASTGFVGSEASRWWGSSQAVLSLAATQLEAIITIAPPNYNVPAHLIEYGEQNNSKITIQDAIIVHYHWLLYKEYLKDGGVFYGGDTLPKQVLDWLKARIPLRERYTWTSYVNARIRNMNEMGG
ncbi:MAG TPA: hypothetical protein VF896_10775 [Anaerolineales bacterium]